MGFENVTVTITYRFYILYIVLTNAYTYIRRFCDTYVDFYCMGTDTKVSQKGNIEIYLGVTNSQLQGGGA